MKFGECQKRGRETHWHHSGISGVLPGEQLRRGMGNQTSRATGETPRSCPVLPPWAAGCSWTMLRLVLNSFVYVFMAS